MKRIITIILFGIIGVFASICDVYALENDSTLTTNYIDNTYAYHYKNGVLRSYGKLPFRYQNGQLVYCIEPDRVINYNTYNSTYDWSITGFSEDVKKQMELIVYFGYKYRNHDTLRYYMATQELIWLFSDDYVKWMDTYSTDGSIGNQINVDNEKNEILSLINNYKKVPSFVNQSYTGFLGQELTFTDTNNVLNNYSYQGSISSYSNSIIKVKLNKFGNNKINFIKKINLGLTTVYYHNSDSQMMAQFKLRDEINASLDIMVDKARVKIIKKDNETNKVIKQKDIIFKIKNTITNEYIDDNLRTDKEGCAYIDLKEGEYEIEEIKSPNGYVLNKEPKKIIINNDITLTDGYYVVDIFNDKPKGKITIKKEDEEGNLLNDVEIGLFDKNHNLLSTIKTNGDDYFDNLNLGTYYIKELQTKEGYLLDDKEYKVDLKYIDDKTYIVEKHLKLVNKKIRCDITYISSDNLDGITINVYDENDKEVFSGITKDGKLTISGLTYGKYYIKQIKIPKGYILNEDEYVFYVNDSTCLSNIKVHNEKTVMPITSTSLNKCLTISYILSFIGLFIYGKKVS